MASSIVVVLMASVLVASVLGSTAAAAGAGGGKCDGLKHVVITQGLGEPQRDGSSEYRVDVVNQCGDGDGDGGNRCGDVSGIHLRCPGNFRSVTPVDPKVLRVVGPADCLLIDGGAVRQGGNVSFVYTSFMRNSLFVLSATCAAAAV